MLIYNQTTNKYFWRNAEITEQEYQKIREIIRNKPTAPDGQDYRLTDGLKWELYDLPPVEIPEDPDQAEYEALITAYERGVNDAE